MSRFTQRITFAAMMVLLVGLPALAADSADSTQQQQQNPDNDRAEQERRARELRRRRLINLRRQEDRLIDRINDLEDDRLTLRQQQIDQSRRLPEARQAVDDAQTAYDITRKTRDETQALLKTLQDRLSTAEAQLEAYKKKRSDEFLQSEEMVALAARVDQTRRAIEAARIAALRPLENDEAYQKALVARDAAKQQLITLRHSEQPEPTELMQLSQEMINQDKIVNGKQQDLLNASVPLARAIGEHELAKQAVDVGWTRFRFLLAGEQPYQAMSSRATSAKGYVEDYQKRSVDPAQTAAERASAALSRAQSDLSGLLRDIRSTQAAIRSIDSDLVEAERDLDRTRDLIDALRVRYPR